MAVTITLTVSNAVAAEVQTAAAGMYPIPLDPATHAPLFTQAAWAKELGRQFYVQLLRQWRRQQLAAIVDPEGDVT